ncbi:MAG: non-ribosomal peptide synthetase [Longimicrobiaceae bacterium]
MGAGTTRSVVEGYRASPQQRQLWRLHEERGGRGGCAWAAVEIGGELDAALLRAAVDAVVERHEILRTTVLRVPEVDEPVQVIGEPRVAWEADADWSAASAAEVEARLQRQALEALRHPLELDGDPLLAAALVRTGERAHLLTLRLPALLADETTLRELPAAIGRAYAALADGGDDDEPLQYADLAEWRNEALESESGAEGRRYWARHAAARPALPESLRAASSAAEGFAPARQTLRLEPALAAALERAAAAASVPLPALLLGALHALLHRLAQRPEVRVALYCDGRAHAELRGALGPVGGYLPVDAAVSPERPFAELAARLARETGETRAWQDAYVPDAAEAGDVAFAFHAEPAPARLGGLAWSLRDAAAFAGPFALSLVGRPRGDTLELALLHDAARVSGVGAERFAEALHTLLREVAARPEAPVEALEVVGGRERSLLLDEWNDTAAADPGEEALHAPFERRAAERPHAVALVAEGTTFTYAELNAHAAALARALRAAGVAPGSVVGLCTERSVEMVVGILGVLKAGSAYLPLDPAHPADRLGFMLRDARPRAILTQPHLAARLPAFSGPVLMVDGSGQPPAGGAAEAEPAAPGGERLAYVMYTSGSTGAPKAVMIPHRGIWNCIRHLSTAWPLDETDAVLFKTPFTFDPSLEEIFHALWCGARLVIGDPEAHRDPAHVVETVVRHRITATQLVPSLLEAMLEQPGVEACTSLRVVFSGGEALRADLARRAAVRLPEMAVVNGYGPTEVSVEITLWHYRGDEAGPLVPIGRPIANTRIYLLDDHLHLVPVGVAGELYAGGLGVGHGYLGRPALTAERFVPDPFSPVPGARMYRTGDLARYGADGTIEFIGRVDFQVKVHGVRIEPGEIEAALREHPAVREAVVVAHGAGRSPARLAAYVVPAAGAAPNAGELRAFLLERLPAPMVPGVFVALDALPRTSTGKLDRQALPEPGAGRPALGHAYQAPRDEVETALAAIWREVLGVETVGVRDDFFELGGDSFVAVRLMARIEKRFGRRLPLAALIEAATVETIARLLADDAGAEERLQYIVPIQPEGSRPPLFCIHGGEGTVLCYRGLRALDADQPVYGIQALDFDIGRRPLDDLVEMARRYVAAILAFHPEGPYLLAGWSFGGIVAFEMARQLHAMGKEVRRVILFDCRYPLTDGPMSRIDPVMMRISMLFNPAHLVRGGVPVVTSAELAGLTAHAQLALIAGRLGIRDPRLLIPPHVDPERLDEYLDIRMIRAQAAQDYVPGVYEGRGITLFRAAELDLDTPFPEAREAFLAAAASVDYGWGEICPGGVEVHTVPGTHEEMFQERNAAGLVQALRRCLEADPAVPA